MMLMTLMAYAPKKLFEAKNMLTEHSLKNNINVSSNEAKRCLFSFRYVHLREGSFYCWHLYRRFETFFYDIDHLSKA